LLKILFKDLLVNIVGLLLFLFGMTGICTAM